MGSADWHQPRINPEWPPMGMERPLPTRHVAQINHAGDAMLAILQDSSTTSSGEEKSPRHSRSASTQSPSVVPVMPSEVTSGMPVTLATSVSSAMNVLPMPTAAAPSMSSSSSPRSMRRSRPVTAVTRKIVPSSRVMTAPHILTPYITKTAPDDDDDGDDDDIDSITDGRPPRELSPVIIKDTVNTGSANR